MTDKIFVDTNILIYAHDLDAQDKHQTCKAQVAELWNNGNGVISTQVMQEFYVNVTRKINTPLSLGKARQVLNNYAAWQVETIEPQLIFSASEIQERNQLSFWDALIIAAAVQAEAGALFSEDLNAGQTIEGIEVLNPMSKRSDQ